MHLRLAHAIAAVTAAGGDRAGIGAAVAAPDFAGLGAGAVMMAFAIAGRLIDDEHRRRIAETSAAAASAVRVSVARGTGAQRAP